ncbi:MAG: hypothetical protein ABEI53_03530 [Candidatus Magasanikbacteria bacterium]
MITSRVIAGVGSIHFTMNFGIQDENLNKDDDTRHYYGDAVRNAFFVGVLLMAVSLPFFVELVPWSPYISLFVIVVLDLVAGLISPKQKLIITFDLLISLGASLVFEYYAIVSYAQYSAGSAFFWVNQILALTFLFALYYSAKTFRGVVLENKN